MRRSDGWTVKRGPEGLQFSDEGAGFTLDTRATNGSSAHTLVTGTFELDDGDQGELQIGGSCVRSTDADVRSYMSCVAEFLDVDGGVVGRREHRIDFGADRFDVMSEGGRPADASRLRLTFNLNRLFKLRASLGEVMVRLVHPAPDAAILDDFRAGYAWPGTSSMRWLAGKSMYVCAGCELTYMNEFLAQTGLQIHHTFVHQEAMDPVMEAANPQSSMWHARPDFMVLSTVQSFRSLLSSHEQRRATLDQASLERRLDEYVHDLGDVISRLRASVICPIWLATNPYTATSAYGIHDYRIDDGGMSGYELILMLKLRLFALAREHREVYVLDPDIALESTGKGSPTRPLVRPHETLGGHLERLGARYLAEYLHHQMLVVATSAPRIKCVVVDCDNTLWKGVIREDGPAHIELNRTRMQRLWHLGLRGIPIALCTKNDPEDEAAILEAISSYGRLHEKIVATRIDWKPKSEGIRSIAKQLNIGLDTIAFFDDSPFEREQVATALPEVRVYPETAIAEAPDWHLFHPPGDLTSEARERVERYLDDASRSASQSTFAGDAEGFERFLHSCSLRVEVRPASPSELSRVAELLQRTNQMNATLKRLSSRDVVALHERDDGAVHVVKLGDKFGDYGIIGTSLVERRERGLTIIELALSCRAMGRRVEDALLEELIGYAVDLELDRIDIDVTATSRNQQIIETLRRVGFAEAADGQTDADGTSTSTWTLKLAGSGRRGREFAPWFQWDAAIGDLDD